MKRFVWFVAKILAHFMLRSVFHGTMEATRKLIEELTKIVFA